MVAADPVQLIEATLAPVFLISGAAIFLNFVQARLFRVIDRLRKIGGDLSTDATDPERRRELLAQRARQIRRAIILRNAILFGVLVIGFTVLTTLLILVEGLATAISGVPLVSFALALVSFSVALVLASFDAFLSVAAARHAAKEFSEGLRPGEG